MLFYVLRMHVSPQNVVMQVTLSLQIGFFKFQQVFSEQKDLLLFVLDLLMNFFAFYSDSYSIIKNKQRSHQILFV